MSVWRRLSRVGKRAAKFKFVFHVQEVQLEAQKGAWTPKGLSISLTRRNRRYATKPVDWVPTIQNPFSGSIVWAHPDAIEFETTLYRADSRSNSTDFEDKQWHLVIEDAEVAVGSSANSSSKRNILAAVEINAKDYAAADGRVNHTAVTLRPVSKKVKSAKVHFSVSCVCVKEGRATDEDMMSMASILSMQQRGMSSTASGSAHHLRPGLSSHHAADGPDFGDVGNLRDFDDENSISPAGTLSRRQANKQIAALAEQFGLLVEEANGDSANNRKSRASSTLSSSFNGGGSSAVTNTSSFAAVRKDSLTNSSTPLSDDGTSGGAVVVAEAVGGPADLPSLDSPSRSPQEHDAETRNPVLSSTLLSTNAFVRLDDTPSLSPVKHTPHAVTPDKVALPVSPQKAASHVVNNQSEDLLNWAQEATQHYHGVRVTNFTTSWRNGMAFCAVIHHFRPDLIAYDSLHANHIEENCRIAFGAAARVGVPRLLDPQDMVSRQQPDKLAVMTYVHQLRMFLDNSTSQQSVRFASAKHAADAPVVIVNKNGADEQHAPLNSSTAADEVLPNHERKNSYRYFASTLSPVSESSKASSSSLSLSTTSSNPASPQHKNSSGSSNVVRVLQPTATNVSPLTRTAAAATSLANVGRAATLREFYRPNNNSSADEGQINGDTLKSDETVIQSERHDRARRLVSKNQQPLSPTNTTQFSPQIHNIVQSSSADKMQPPSSFSAVAQQREDELRVRARQMIHAFKHGRYREMQQQSRRPNSSLLTNSPAAVPLMPSASASTGLPVRQPNVSDAAATRSAGSSALLNSATIESPLQRFRTTNATVRFRPIAPPTADGFSRMPSIRRSMRFLSRPTTPSTTLQRNATMLSPFRRANQLGRHAQSTERLPVVNDNPDHKLHKINDAQRDDAGMLAANISAAVDKLNAELMRSVADEHAETTDDIRARTISDRNVANNDGPPLSPPANDAVERVLPYDNPIESSSDRRRDAAIGIDAARSVGADTATAALADMPVGPQAVVSVDGNAGDRDAFVPRSNDAEFNDQPSSPNKPFSQERPSRRPSRSSGSRTNLANDRHGGDEAADDAASDAQQHKSSNNNQTLNNSGTMPSSVADSSPPPSLLSNNDDEQSSIERDLRELLDEQQIVDRRARLVEQQLRKYYGAAAAVANVASAENGSAGDASHVQQQSASASKTSSTRDDALLTEWFQLVNKKNELIRREMMLRIREKEAELLKKYNKVNLELQHFHNMAESEKTTAQRKREKMLLDELMEIVNERNELVKQTDVQEQAAEEDAIVGRSAIAHATEMLANGGNTNNHHNSTSGSSTLTAALAAKFSAFLAQTEQNGSTTTTTTTTTTTGNTEMMRRAAAAAGVMAAGSADEDDKNCVIM